MCSKPDNEAQNAQYSEIETFAPRAMVCAARTNICAAINNHSYLITRRLPYPRTQMYPSRAPCYSRLRTSLGEMPKRRLNAVEKLAALV